MTFKDKYSNLKYSSTTQIWSIHIYFGTFYKLKRSTQGTQVKDFLWPQRIKFHISCENKIYYLATKMLQVFIIAQ